MIKQTKTALIIGATSAVAMCVIEHLAEQGYTLYLLARNAQRLTSLVQDIASKYPSILIYSQASSLTELKQQESLIQQVHQKLDHIDLALIAYGVLPDSERVRTDRIYSLDSFQTNATSVIGYLTLLTPIFEQQGQGSIAVLSSVAGDRGRKSNFIYGSAKAAVSEYCSGLRASLAATGVHVLTVKPGFIDTPMTAHITPKTILWAKPDKIASDILHAIKHKKAVLYTPKFWRIIMGIVKHLPEWLFIKIN